MQRTNFNVRYEDADYDDGGTGLEREQVFKTLFIDDESGYQASAGAELSVLEETVDDVGTVSVSLVRVSEEDDDSVNLHVYTSDLTVGTQLNRQGGHSHMVWRGDEYSTYRVEITQ